MPDLPTTIGPYAISEKLGAGGMGAVYRGRHRETDQSAAVKVLSAAMAREPGLVERFRREIGSLKQLTNPHIVQFFDSGEHDEAYYYAMELVEGETLTSRLNEVKRIGWERVIEVGVQVCSALKAAHDAGIIHRDLKPGNLMLTADDTVKLTDFGVAQIFAASKLTATGGIVGTVEYMSPEQAQGRRAHRTSDLYSLGAVMYCMLTGRPPFSGRNMVEIIQKHRYGQFDPPRSIVPEIPRWLDEVVCRLLEKDPEDRYPDAYVLSLRLQEIPRKVSLAEEGSSPGDVDARTVVLDSATGLSAGSGEKTEGMTAVTASARSVGPGEATLVRDLMRIEIERQQQRSPLLKWLNSTTGLLVCLSLAIVLAVVMWQRGRLDPEQRFAEAVRLLEADEPDWQTARGHLAPLIAEDRERWSERAAPYLARIEQLAIESRSRPAKRIQARDVTEMGRFLRLAREYERLGDRGRAVRILESALELAAGQQEWESEAEVARGLLQEWKQESAAEPGRSQLATAALVRARRARQAGRIEEARRVWESIVELYSGDVRAREAVAEARRGLTETEDAGQ
ncbi:MAG: protein kinase [Planctomycetaceae bacterium]|jgi:serine/threonine-protein kinase|nr:protein kinase [Planctomycetaceae bacterium]